MPKLPIKTCPSRVIAIMMPTVLEDLQMELGGGSQANIQLEN